MIYTKRFYRDVVETGAQSASPLLFPETVFNAPASHLAAILGVTGTTYTVVGDGAVGLLAIKMAEDVMTNERSRLLPGRRDRRSRLVVVRRVLGDGVCFVLRLRLSHSVNKSEE